MKNSNTPQIPPVRDNYDKYKAYHVELGRYSKAINNGFYFEALLIVYAMMEDRLRSFIYYIGGVQKSDDLNLNVSKTKGILRRLYFGSDELALGKRMDLKKISVKEDLVRATLRFTVECDHEPEEAYLAALKDAYERCLDINGLLQTLKEIDKWRGYRNEVIHGLLHKNTESLNSNLREQVEAGMGYARFLDNQVKALKAKNLIRTQMKIEG